jgi:hypothetical protein
MEIGSSDNEAIGYAPAITALITGVITLVNTHLLLQGGERERNIKL